MTIGPKGGPLENFFFQNMFLWFENNCFDERKRFFIFSNAFEAYLKFFKTESKKNLRGDLRTKGGTIGKNFFQNMFLSFENDCFDERKRFIHILKRIWSIVKNFQNWSEKKFKGDLRTKGGTIGKKFFQNMFLSFENDCFDERKRFIIFWNAIWSILKNFQNWSEKI